MNELFAASAAAAWFGFLSSISPCTLAANLAAVTFAGRKVGPVRAAVLSGLLYSAGRTASCSLLGFGLVSGILNAPELSHLLQKYMNLLMGPLLVVAAMFLLDLLSFASHGRGLAGKFQNIAERLGIWGAFAFGVIFALSFCPASAVLFFGSLLPLAVKVQSAILLPAEFGIATGLPVLALAFLLGFCANRIGSAYHKLAKFEFWAQRITGVFFLAAGIVMTLAMPLGIRPW